VKSANGLGVGRQRSANLSTPVAPVSLPTGGAWQSATFDLLPAQFTLVGGSASLSNVLDSVTTMRILHAAAPAWNGDSVVGTLGVDNIQAIPEPASLLILAGCAPVLWLLRRRHRAHAH